MKLLLICASIPLGFMVMGAWIRFWFNLSVRNKVPEFVAFSMWVGSPIAVAVYLVVRVRFLPF